MSQVLSHLRNAGALQYDIEVCHCQMNWQHDASHAKPSGLQISQVLSHLHNAGALEYDIEGCHCQMNWHHDACHAVPSDLQMSQAFMLACTFCYNVMALGLTFAQMHKCSYGSGLGCSCTPGV